MKTTPKSTPKPTRNIPKVETKNSVAIKLAAEFHVTPESVFQWYESGCPVSFEEGKAWKIQRLEEAKIRRHNGKTPCRYEKARGEAANANKEPNWELMSPEFVNLCDVVADLYLAGLTTSRIQQLIGSNEEIIYRIITNHPRTKDKDKEISASAWSDIRRLAQSEIRNRLRDPEERKKIKAGDLNFLAGTAHDKIEKGEAPQQVNVNIRAKIEAMSYEELISQIRTASADVVEGEFQIEGGETSPQVRNPEIKTSAQSQQQPLLTPKKDSDNATD
jgi:hypothetical protein